MNDQATRGLKIKKEVLNLSSDTYNVSRNKK